jgi:hypothetical protein
MALSIPIEIAGTAPFTFSTAGSALDAGERLTGGTGSVANTTLFVRVPLAASPPVTAYATGISFSQQIAGAPIYTAQGQDNSIFEFNTAQSFATPVVLQGGNAASSGSVTFRLTALGAECAKGIQTGTVTLTLSSFALSGNAGSTSIVKTASDTTATTTITVTAVNTASEGDGIYTCQAEARRLWVLGYVG